MKRHLISLALSTLALASQAASFELHSSSLKPGATIAAQHYWNNFGCSGGNVMPT